MELTLDEKFEKAAKDVNQLISTPENDDLLEIYSLYKQATMGDCDTSKPGMFDFKGKAKWEAWNNKKGLNRDTAKEQYIAKVEALIASIGKK